MHYTYPEPTRYLSQSQATILIEELVQAIDRSKKSAFHINKHGQVTPTPLSARFRHIDRLLNVYSDHYDYSEHLQVFWDACQDIGLERSPAGPVCLDASGLHYLSAEQSMNVLVEQIRQLTQEPKYCRKVSGVDRRYQARKKAAAVEDYVLSVLNRYSRTVVIRVDLHYLKTADPLLRIEDLYTDLSTLIRARERNPIFEHETGYIWSVEQGEDKGFHIHTAFFFNGAEVRSDWSKAQAVGELWEQITNGRGYFYSCNANKAKYQDLGIGTIKRADDKACDNTADAMVYLAKDSQHLRIKPLRARTFGMGQMPRARSI